MKWNYQYWNWQHFRTHCLCQLQRAQQLKLANMKISKDKARRYIVFVGWLLFECLIWLDFWQKFWPPTLGRSQLEKRSYRSNLWLLWNMSTSVVSSLPKDTFTKLGRLMVPVKRRLPHRTSYSDVCYGPHSQPLIQQYGLYGLRVYNEYDRHPRRDHEGSLFNLSTRRSSLPIHVRYVNGTGSFFQNWCFSNLLCGFFFSILLFHFGSLLFGYDRDSRCHGLLVVVFCVDSEFWRQLDVRTQQM